MATPTLPQEMIAEIQAYVQHFAAATATNQPYKAPNVKLPEFSGKTGEKVEEWLFLDRPVLQGPTRP